VSDSIVLCYHAVSPAWPAPLSVTPEQLESQLRLLRTRGYRGAGFSELTRAEPGSRLVAVTFDDAFKSVLTLADPILSRLGFVGTLFVPTDFPDRDGPLAWPGIDHWLGGEFEPELAHLSWGEIEGMAARGWEIGSHTRSHPHLTELADDRLDEELGGSRRVCEERLGASCTSLAYPYGDFDRRVVAAAGRAGYECACTLPRRLHPAEPLAWPRIGVYNGDRGRRFALKVSPTVRRVRSSRAWTRMDAARRTLGR
jgi:peptidoglycan/xylan/chitin deacetylase (PgdA/CDA1 family)